MSVAFQLPFTYEHRNDADIDWQQPNNARNSFSLRLANAYFGNKWCSDITFYVPMEDFKVPAHSMIVAAASPFLQRCCFGTGTLKGDQVVTVPDYCTAEVLLIVLRYLYVGGTAEGIDESNVGLVLKLADCYELCELQKQCESKIESILSNSNVCQIFNDIHNVSIQLVDKCVRHMTANTSAILHNAMEMEDDALGKLLRKSCNLNIQSEIVLVASMIKWADAQCVIKSIENTPVNRRHVLGKRTKMINFGSMKIDEFLDSVNLFGQGFFTDNEISLTTQQIHRLGKPTTSKDTLVYPFASINRCLPIPMAVETVCNIVERPSMGLIISTINNNSTTHSLTLNVGHMKQTFTLTGFKTMDNGSITMIKHMTMCAWQNIPFKVYNGYVQFEVKPRNDGRISISFETKSLVRIFAIEHISDEYPRILSHQTCIRAFKYTH